MFSSLREDSYDSTARKRWEIAGLHHGISMHLTTLGYISMGESVSSPLIPSTPRPVMVLWIASHIEGSRK